MKKYKLVHKRDRCIGCNSCVTIAPQSWIMDESDGKVRLVCGQKKKDVYVTEIFEEDYESNRQAAEACPMRIIRIEK